MWLCKPFYIAAVNRKGNHHQSHKQHFFVIACCCQSPLITSIEISLLFSVFWIFQHHFVLLVLSSPRSFMVMLGFINFIFNKKKWRKKKSLPIFIYFHVFPLSLLEFLAYKVRCKHMQFLCTCHKYNVTLHTGFSLISFMFAVLFCFVFPLIFSYFFNEIWFVIFFN